VPNVTDRPLLVPPRRPSRGEDDPRPAAAPDRDDVRPEPAERGTPEPQDTDVDVQASPEPTPDQRRRRRAADPVEEPAAEEQPRRRRRAAETGDRPVGTSGTGRSVSRARAEARTAKVPARTEEPAARTTKTRRPDDGPHEALDERLRADHIDETLTRLTAAHAGLVLGAHDDEEDDEADDDVPERRARPAVRAGRYTVAAVAFLLVLAAGLGWAGRTRLDAALTQVAAVDVAADGVVDAAAQTGDENVLVLAIDSGGSAGATTRANTVAVMHRDARGDRSVAVTLPPQLEITRPPCERWDPAAATYLGQTVPAEPRTTFGSAYAVGGPRCATRAAQQVTGLAITRFVAVDLAATSALVEVVGGVQVCVERPVLDSVLGPVAAAAGTDAYNGARAATLVRTADVRGEPAGGAALVQRQQRVLAAALERALSPAALLHPGRVSGVAPALDTTVVSTDTGVADLLALSSGLGEVRSVPVEPQPNSRNNIELRETEAQALFAAVRTDAALPAPDAAATSSAPADVTADVLNASGRDGLAAEVAGTLGELGFRTAEVRNAGQPALDTVVRFSPDRADQAHLLADAVPSATAVPDPGTSGVLQLVLGRSFDGTVRASTGPDPAVDTPTPVAPAAICG
jgi:LCP family protein required for cell wall assembly